MKPLLTAAFLLTATHAAAQSCFTYDDFKTGTVENGMSLTFSGMTGDQSTLVQIYTRPDGAWVIASVSLGGVACILTGGEAHDLLDAPIPGTDG